MESIISTLTVFGALVAGLIARVAVLPLLLVLLALPVVLLVFGVRGVQALRRRAAHLADADGLVWRSDLYYALGHTWVRPGKGRLTVGLDDLAQRILAGASRVELPEPGTPLQEGDVASVVTCGEKCVPIVSPVEGVVTAVNEAVTTDPSVIHHAPYTHGWLFAVRPSTSAYTRLPRGERVREWLREESARLAYFLEHNLGVASADGGEFLAAAPSLLSDDQWDTLTAAFLNPGHRQIEASAGDSAPEAGVRDEASSPSPSMAGMFRAIEDGIQHVPKPLLPLVAIGGAIAGGVYVLCLPLIGFAMLLGLSGVKIWQGLRQVILPRNR